MRIYLRRRTYGFAYCPICNAVVTVNGFGRASHKRACKRKTLAALRSEKARVIAAIQTLIEM